MAAIELQGDVTPLLGVFESSPNLYVNIFNMASEKCDTCSIKRPIQVIGEYIKRRPIQKQLNISTIFIIDQSDVELLKCNIYRKILEVFDIEVEYPSSLDNLVTITNDELSKRNITLHVVIYIRTSQSSVKLIIDNIRQFLRDEDILSIHLLTKGRNKADLNTLGRFLSVHAYENKSITMLSSSISRLTKGKRNADKYMVREAEFFLTDFNEGSCMVHTESIRKIKKKKRKKALKKKKSNKALCKLLRLRRTRR